MSLIKLANLRNYLMKRKMRKLIKAMKCNNIQEFKDAVLPIPVKVILDELIQVSKNG